MKLLILDGPRAPQGVECPNYRGTYRAHPTFCEASSEHDEINRLFFWFLESGGELGVVGDITKALRFAELWNIRMAGKGSFEVIEVIEGNAVPESQGRCIGFDLSAGYNNSLLWCGLKFGGSLEGIPQPVRDMWNSLRDLYAPQLNRNGLFQTCEIASECLRSMRALQDLSPNFFEGGEFGSFQVTALYLAS